MAMLDGDEWWKTSLSVLRCLQRLILGGYSLWWRSD
jgi:hypothetical protein